MAAAAVNEGWRLASDGGRAVGLLLAAAACALTPGLLTTAAAAAVAVTWMGAATLKSSLPVATGPAWFVGSVCLAMMLLGPGAYSLDARLFGRREIVIPRTRRPPAA